MNNLSELIVRGTPTPEKLHQSEAWAKKALDIIESTKRNTKDTDKLSICELALAAVYFNLGSLREMADDRVASREMYNTSLIQSKAIGMKEGMLEARVALRRLDRLDRAANRISPLDHTKGSSES